MTYRAACSVPGLPRHPEPMIYCDGCTATARVSRAGVPYAWFLAGKPPRGWQAAPKDEFRSWHWCPTCRTWANELLSRGLVRDSGGWSRPGSRVRLIWSQEEGVLGALPTLVRWSQAPEGVIDSRTPMYATEEEAARAWLLTRGAGLLPTSTDSKADARHPPIGPKATGE